MIEGFKPEPSRELNEKLTVCFIASQGGKSGIKKAVYVMDEKDAIKFCSSDKTKGHSGTKWMMCWDYIESFIDEKGFLNPKKFIKDDGRFDALILELGIKPHSIDKLQKINFKKD